MARSQWWFATLFGVVAVAGCAQLVGLTGEYREQGSSASGGAGGMEPPGGGDGGDSTSGGTGGSDGGTSTGGESTGGESTGGMGATGGTPPMGGAPSGGSPPLGGTSTGGESGNGGAGAGAGGSAGTDGSTRPSCNDLPSNCGLQGRSDCCESTLIEGGDFDRSSDARYPATISSFHLDVFELSVGRFRNFVTAFDDGFRPATGSGRNAKNPADLGWNAEWNELLPPDKDSLLGSEVGVMCIDSNWPTGFATWTHEPSGNERRPMNCLDWYLAYALCIWDGGRLPTEAEWNYAAAGGSEQRAFPWSDPPSLITIGETYASYFVDDTRQCGGDGVNGCEPTDIVFVGTKKDGYGRFRQADLSGNVWEWTQDAFHPYGAECQDCANLDDGGQRVGRGGGYISNLGLLRTESRVGFTATYRSSAFGVRCARDDPHG